ncbi:hypothetical protein [Hydrogenimonas sp.]
MRQFIAALLLFFIGALFLPLSAWLDDKSLEIQKINRRHLIDIRKLKKIKEINAFLEKEIFPDMEKIGSADTYDLQMLKYFDTYREPFGLKLERFIYFDKENAQMDYRFETPRQHKKRLYRLLNHKFENGMIGFFTFGVNEKSVEGKLRLYRLFAKKDRNASAR